MITFTINGKKQILAKNLDEAFSITSNGMNNGETATVQGGGGSHKFSITKKASGFKTEVI